MSEIPKRSCSKCGRAQSERKKGQKSANESPQKSAKARKTVQMSVLRKSCKGVGHGGREENCPKASFLGRRHDNLVLKVQFSQALSRFKTLSGCLGTQAQGACANLT